MSAQHVTPAERKEWLGREVEMTTGQPPKTRTRRYTVLDVARFGPNGDLKLMTGTVDAGALGTVGLFVSAADVVVVAS